MASFVDSLVAPLSLVNALLVEVSRKKNGDLSKTFQTLEKIWGGSMGSMRRCRSESDRP